MAHHGQQLAAQSGQKEASTDYGRDRPYVQGWITLGLLITTTTIIVKRHHWMRVRVGFQGGKKS